MRRKIEAKLRSHICYGLPVCLPPCTDLTGTLPQPSGAFTSRLSARRSPFPPLDITTAVTGPPLLAGLAPAGMTTSLAARSPRYPGDPSRAFASVHDPGRIDAPSPVDGWVDAAPARTTAKASASWLYRGYCGASAPAAYASRMVLPPSMQGSLPAGWLAFAGRELNPLDRDKRFQITFSFPSSGFILAQRPKASKGGNRDGGRCGGAAGAMEI